ncbi:hypothetical protein TNCV_3219071 [Trichonephila clavipes]|nr:hypothetical protein TNCV_3219071 [Trichonephila clavipes]
MIVQFRNEKVSNHGSIPITIDCNVVAFIVFEEGFHQPIKRTKHWDGKMNGDCKAKLAAGTVVEIEAGASLFTDPISDAGKCI